MSSNNEDMAMNDLNSLDIHSQQHDEQHGSGVSPFMFRQVQMKDSSLLSGLEGIAPELFSKTFGSPTSGGVFLQTPGLNTPRVLGFKFPFNSPPAVQNGDTYSSSQSYNSHHAVPSSGYQSHAFTYPVLHPILNQLDFLSPSLITDLLEVYFTNTYYGVASTTRKSSILAIGKHPRHCSHALLFSFLLVAAHVSDHPAMTATPTTRMDIITRLKELTLRYLRPLEHSKEGGCLDDVITYIHLGVISSASEFKGASIKWWHAAWGLARVLKLNIENQSLPELTREEQRRVWWLLFLVDRHLCLCYNRPISVLDCESTELYRPIAGDIWDSDAELIPTEMDPSRIKGLHYRVTGPDVYGYLLPLMTLLGGIDDLHQLEINPTLALTPEVVEPIRRRLRFYLSNFLNSVETYDENFTAKENSDAVRAARMSPTSVDDVSEDCPTVTIASPVIISRRPVTYANCWKEYCRCLINVFYILVSGYWDPIELMSLPPAMVLDPDFALVIGHSLEAARSIRRILDADPDLHIIPFFFGIIMLQGSFSLLYLVDVIGGEEVRHACETLVRAHEVCIVTLNTEYQRNFRQILRGALQAIVHDRRVVHSPSPTSGSVLSSSINGGAGETSVASSASAAQRRYLQMYSGSGASEMADDVAPHLTNVNIMRGIGGRITGEPDESRRRRMDLLGLYRWIPGGHGLAV